MCHRSKRCHFKDVSTNGNKKKIKAYFRGCGRGIRWKTFHRSESETEGNFRIKVNFLIETEIHSRRIRSIDSRGTDTPTSSGPARQQLDGLINSLVKTRLSLYFPLKKQNHTLCDSISFGKQSHMFYAGGGGGGRQTIKWGWMVSPWTVNQAKTFHYQFHLTKNHNGNYVFWQVWFLITGQKLTLIAIILLHCLFTAKIVTIPDVIHLIVLSN